VRRHACRFEFWGKNSKISFKKVRDLEKLFDRFRKAVKKYVDPVMVLRCENESFDFICRDCQPRGGEGYQAH